ncbi:MAG: hypothetical protein H0Z39_05435 [Peptococcaceae bacterium]|nr:hypothetical protein [Peptococcaceae bacterium]
MSAGNFSGEFFLDGHERLWVWDRDQEWFGEMALADFADIFEPGRYATLSINPVTGLAETTAVEGTYTSREECQMMTVSLVSGHKIAISNRDLLLTVDERGRISWGPVIDYSPVLVLHRIAVSSQEPVLAQYAGNIIRCLSSELDQCAEYGWLRRLACEAWGWDRLEDKQTLTAPVRHELRAAVERRASKVRVERLKNMDCHDCVIKLAGYMGLSVSLVAALSWLDYIVPVKVASVEPEVNKSKGYNLKVAGDNHNYVTAQGILVRDTGST